MSIFETTRGACSSVSIDASHNFTYLSLSRKFILYIFEISVGLVPALIWPCSRSQTELLTKQKRNTHHNTTPYTAVSANSSERLYNVTVVLFTIIILTFLFPRVYELQAPWKQQWPAGQEDPRQARQEGVEGVGTA